MSRHPILIPHGGTVCVCWLTGEDGRRLAEEFCTENPNSKPKLLAQARQVAVKGCVGKVPENGHWLKGDFSEIYELKPGDYRYFGFRHRDHFYITNGAMKQKPSKQNADYRLALQRRAEFLASASSPSKNR